MSGGGSTVFRGCVPDIGPAAQGASDQVAAVAGLALAAVARGAPVTGIRGDTPLRPLEDDFSEPYTSTEQDKNIFFVAACPRPAQ